MISYSKTDARDRLVRDDVSAARRRMINLRALCVDIRGAAAVLGLNIWEPVPSPFLPSLFFPFPFPFHPLPLPFLPHSPKKQASLKHLDGLGEHCMLPQQGLGHSQSGNRILCILALKSDIWRHQIYSFSENQLTTACQEYG